MPKLNNSTESTYFVWTYFNVAYGFTVTTITMRKNKIPSNQEQKSDIKKWHLYGGSHSKLKCKLKHCRK